MEMRAREDIDIGQDITPPLPPLAFALHRSSLSSHCSSCSRRLPFPLSSTSPSLNYCSSTCATTATPLHHASAEHHLLYLLSSRPSLYPYPDSSDLRLSLRLLLHLSTSTSTTAAISPPSRLLGLLTNWKNTTAVAARDSEDNERLRMIRSGARVVAMARVVRDGNEGEFDENAVFEMEECVLCLVMTNAVEVDDSDGGGPVGGAVYDWRFSWINHSCAPNSCFRFVNAFEEAAAMAEEECDSLRIAPCGGDGQMKESGPCIVSDFSHGCMNYAPRVIVRSIKAISRSEEVTVTYTDLLQPKNLRQSELLLNHQFVCDCKRCAAVPQTYADQRLQEIFCSQTCGSCLNNDYKEKAIEMLADAFNDSIEEFMEVGDPVKCCEKIEELLSGTHVKYHFRKTGLPSDIDFKVSPLYHISLNAYTTLKSAYKIRADLISGKEHFFSFDMSRISAAYSLLLAGTTHRLFLSELSLITSAATFWIDAGQSLLSLARCSSWSSIETCLSRIPFSLDNTKCSKCSLMDIFESNISSSKTQHRVCIDIGREFLNCTSVLSQKVWSFLIHGCSYLKDIKDPINFGWLTVISTVPLCTETNHRELCLCSCSRKSAENCADCNDDLLACDTRTNVFQLGIHCLLYGGFLSSTCYGNFHLNAQIVRRELYCQVSSANAPRR